MYGALAGIGLSSGLSETGAFRQRLAPFPRALSGPGGFSPPDGCGAAGRAHLVSLFPRPDEQPIPPPARHRSLCPRSPACRGPHRTRTRSRPRRRPTLRRLVPTSRSPPPQTAPIPRALRRGGESHRLWPRPTALPPKSAKGSSDPRPRPYARKCGTGSTRERRSTAVGRPHAARPPRPGIHESLPRSVAFHGRSEDAIPRLGGGRAKPARTADERRSERARSPQARSPRRFVPLLDDLLHALPRWVVLRKNSNRP
jgi:hypothetical protein